MIFCMLIIYKHINEYKYIFAKNTTALQNKAVKLYEILYSVEVNHVYMFEYLIEFRVLVHGH